MSHGHQGEWYDVLLTGLTGGAILTFLTVLLKTAERWLPFLVKRKQELDVVNGITDTHPVYRQMEEAIYVDGAQRVLMLSGHNGGHVPSPLTPFYTSAIHIAADTMEHRRHAGVYEHVTVDAAYINMLLTLMKEGSVRFTTDQNPNTLLHAWYQAEGVQDAFLIYLGVWKRSVIYMSFATYDDKPFTDEQLTKFALRANSIRNLINAK